MNILELTRNVIIHTNRTVNFVLIKPTEYHEKNEQRNLSTLVSLSAIVTLIILKKDLGATLLKLFVSINIDPHSNLYVSWMTTCAFIGILLPTLNMWFNIKPSDISNKVAIKNEKSNSKKLLKNIKVYYNIHFHHQTTNNDYSIKSYDFIENKTFNHFSNPTNSVSFDKNLIIDKTVDFILEHKFFDKKNKPSKENLKRLFNLDFKNITEKIILNSYAKKLFFVLLNLEKLSIIKEKEIYKIIESDKLNTKDEKGLNKNGYGTAKTEFNKNKKSRHTNSICDFFKELEYETRFKK